MSSQEHSLQYIERNSVVHRMDPLSKMAWLIVVAVGLFLYRDPRSGGAMLLAVLTLAVVLARVPIRSVLGSSAAIFSLGILLMIFHFFVDPGKTVFQIGPLAVTDTGLYQGPTFFFRLSVMVLSSFVLIWTTNTRDLMVSLTKIGVPYQFAFAVFLALRFLPIMQREVDAVQAAHAIRGRAARSPLAHRIRLWQRYIFTVLINGLRKGETTATAIECRGFGAFPKRTYVKDVHFTVSGAMLAAIYLAFTVGLLVLERTLL